MNSISVTCAPHATWEPQGRMSCVPLSQASPWHRVLKLEVQLFLGGDKAERKASRLRSTHSGSRVRPARRGGHGGRPSDLAL